MTKEMYNEYLAIVKRIKSTNPKLKQLITDCEAEIIYEMYAAFQNYEGDNKEGFLYGVAKHTILDFYNQEKKHTHENIEFVEEKYISHDDFKLNNLMNENVNYGNEAMMLYCHGFSAKDIAIMFNESVSSIYRNIKKGFYNGK